MKNAHQNLVFLVFLFCLPVYDYNCIHIHLFLMFLFLLMGRLFTYEVQFTHHKGYYIAGKNNCIMSSVDLKRAF